MEYGQDQDQDQLSSAPLDMEYDNNRDHRIYPSNIKRPKYQT